jgi:hypothetical protein
MKVAVIGSRVFTDYQLMKETLDQMTGITEIISDGADERYSEEKNLDLTVFLPDWKNMEKVPVSSRTKIS